VHCVNYCVGISKNIKRNKCVSDGITSENSDLCGPQVQSVCVRKLENSAAVCAPCANSVRSGTTRFADDLTIACTDGPTTQ